MRSILAAVLLLVCLPVFSAPLTVLYMAQAGYDPRDVENRGQEFRNETGIEVEFRFEEYEDIYDLVTGTPGQDGEFDVVLLDNIWTADFADRGILEPVPRELRKTIEDGMIPAIYGANMYENQMWGVPFLANFQLLYTNMDILRKAGYDHPPATLDELREMARAAKDKGLIDYPLFDSLRQEEVLVCELVWLSGAFGHPWDRSPDSLRLDRPENREAVSYLLDLKRQGLLNPYSMQSGEVFAAEVFIWGDALFTTNWTFLIGRLEEAEAGGAPSFNWEVSVLPVARKGMASSTVSGFQGLAVMKTSQRKDEAWRFIEYLASPQFQRRHLDEFPVWTEIWDEPETAVRDPNLDVKRTQVAGAKVRPVHPRYQEISGLIQYWIHAALMEAVPLDTAFRNLQHDIEELGL